MFTETTKDKDNKIHTLVNTVLFVYFFGDQIVTGTILKCMYFHIFSSYHILIYYFPYIYIYIHIYVVSLVCQSGKKLREYICPGSDGDGCVFSIGFGQLLRPLYSIFSLLPFEESQKSLRKGGEEREHRHNALVINETSFSTRVSSGILRLQVWYPT